MTFRVAVATATRGTVTVSRRLGQIRQTVMRDAASTAQVRFGVRSRTLLCRDIAYRAAMHFGQAEVAAPVVERQPRETTLLRIPEGEGVQLRIAQVESEANGLADERR